eukprot:28925-Hanusia_phi.AAC.1
MNIKEERLLSESRLRAVLNNRSLIEIGIARYRPGATLTQGILQFVDEHLLDKSGKGKPSLSKHSRRVCTEMAKYGFGSIEQAV